MIGQNQIHLNHQAVIEALQEYVSKRLVKGSEQIVREFGTFDSGGSPPVTPYPYMSQTLGIVVYIEHAKSFVTGTP